MGQMAYEEKKKAEMLKRLTEEIERKRTGAEFLPRADEIEDLTEVINHLQSLRPLDVKTFNEEIKQEEEVKFEISKADIPDELKGFTFTTKELSKEEYTGHVVSSKKKKKSKKGKKAAPKQEEPKPQAADEDELVP